MTKTPFISMKNISKTFPGVKALSDVNFDIFAGEVHALVGENGAGKSTLIKALAGVQPPDEGGKIYVNGKEVKMTCALDATKQGIAVIYQDFSLFPNLTVAENIMLSQQVERGAKFMKWADIRSGAQKALKILKSDINVDATLENLSIAKQQMVAIASAVAQDAKLIVMDEPTSSLSKGEVEHLFSIIRDLASQNIAIMFVSHKLDELFEIADRFTILRDGCYVATKDKNDLNEMQLISLMVGREVNIEVRKQISRGTNTILEVKNLSKPGNFKDISFSLKRGEILGVTGLIGAGRSELFQAIFGLNSPYTGEIFVNGKKANIENPWDAKNYGIAYMPESRQTQGLVMQKTVMENMTLPSLRSLSKRGMIDRKAQLKETKDWIKTLDVRPTFPEREVRQLSGGNQQKVVIGKWLAMKPDIMIVDEPTNGVDVGAKSEIHNLLREMADQGAAVVVITSDLLELMSVSDRILVMRRGRLVAEFENEGLTQEMIMSKAF